MSGGEGASMSRALRVLLVTDAYPPMIGGADRAIRSLARELTRRGYVAVVATAWQGGVPEHEVRDGIHVHRLRDLTSRLPWVSEDPYKHVPPPFPDPEAVVRLRRLIKRVAPDVVQSYGWLTASCAVALMGTRIPLIVSVRDYGNFCAVRTLLQGAERPCSGPAARKCLGCAGRHYGLAKGAVAAASVLGSRRFLARRVAGAHFNSAHSRRVTWQHLLGGRARFGPGAPVEATIYNFRDDSTDAPPDPAILARLPAEPYILFVGALRVVKGVDDLLMAHERLGSTPPLVLMGTRQIDSPRRFGPNVTVLEGVPHGTVMAAWDRALFGVFPSRVAETFGNVVHEAMCCGRPAIGTTAGGHAELIEDGETGLLVRGGDVDGLARAMRRLSEDAALRKRLGEGACERATAFSADRAMSRYASFYDAVIAASPARAPVGKARRLLTW
jgi:glycosyltransferase involved in cell wall biosynthesis